MLSGNVRVALIRMTEVMHANLIAEPFCAAGTGIRHRRLRQQ
jgi:hypothetical protein